MVRRSNAQNEIQDPSLPQKKRARWRLIGATVLALAAMIVLPFALESEPRQVRSDLTVNIPPGMELGKMQKVWPSDQTGSANGKVNNQPIEVAVGANNPQPGRIAGPVAGAATAIGAGAAAAGAAVRRAADKALPTALPERSVQPDPPKVVEPPAVKPVAVPKPVAKAPVVKKQASPKAPTTPKSVAKPAAKSDIRSNETLAALAKKKSAPKPPPVPSRRTNPNQIKAASPGGYVVQIGAFSSRRGAQAQVARAKKLGYNAYTEKIKTKRGDRIRVRVGPYLSRTLANNTRRKLVKAGIDTVLIAP